MLDHLMWLVYLTITILIGLITVTVLYARWNYGTLEKVKGLPVVIKPYFLGGSDLFFYKKVCCDEDQKRVNKYGPIYGMYEGRTPQIFISDPELIRLIFIKEFEYFHSKPAVDFGHPLINEMMDILPYDTWKTVRNNFTPQLTTGKIKAMSFQMLDSINHWILKVQKNADERICKFNPKKAFTALTIDVIARCAFGTIINALDDPDNIFVKNINKLSAGDMDSSIMFSVVLTFPFLASLAPLLPTDATNYFGDVLKTILATRREGDQERMNDFVDTMNDMIDKCSSPEYDKLGITKITVMSQALGFLLAGFETIATTLTLISYRLSKNPEIQEKVIEEIDAYLDRHNGKIGHETIGELVYVNAVINETLRMNASLIRLERVCQKDWYHAPTGLYIKKGMIIKIPVYAVHYDENNFPDPHEFKPERFLPENKDKLSQYAFLSFGQGPHNCIGMRFAKEELQLTIATMMKDFKFEPREDTKLEMRPGRLIFNTYAPFNLNLVRRK